MFKKAMSAVLPVLANQQVDWTLRLRAIESVHEMLEEDEDGELLDELNRNFVQINNQVLRELTQLLDLRSKICNQACILMCACMQKYGVAAEALADKLISKESLLKLLSSGNKVLAESGNETMRAVLSHAPSERYLSKLFHELNHTKNVFVREKLSDGLNIIMQTFEESILERNAQLLEKTLLAGVCDSSAQVRKNTRAAFYTYRQRFEQRGDNLIKRMDPSAVKSIKEEFKLEKSVVATKPPKPEPARTGRIVRQPSVGSKQLYRDVTPENKKKPPRAPQRQLIEITSDQNRPQLESNIKPKRQSHNNYMAKETERPSDDSRINKSLSIVERSSIGGTSSKRGRRDKPVHDWRTEDLEFLMSKINSDAWATRMMSFQKIHEVLMEIDRSKETIHEPTLASIVESFSVHLEDAHVKISSFLVGVMPDIIEQFPQHCAKHSQIILRKCLKGLAECKSQQLKEQLDRLLQCCKKYLSLDLMPHLLQYLEQTKTSRERSVSLDFLIHMLQEDPNCMETKNVGLAVRLMGNLINDYHKDKSISLPALAVMSLVKAKHSIAVLNCLLSIGQNVLSKILELAGEIEPELEGSILRYIQSVDDPLKKRPKSQPPKHKLPAPLRISLEDLLNDKTRANECVEYLVQQLHQRPTNELISHLDKIVLSANSLADSSMIKLVELLKYLTNEQHLAAVSEVIDKLCQEPLHQPLLKCLCRVISSATGPLLESYLQKLSSLISQVNANEYYKLFDHLQALIDSLKITVKANSAEVRRLSIVSLADLYIMLDEEAILEALQPSEQRLVQLYVQRRKQRR